MENIVTIIEYLTREIPNAHMAYMIQDDQNGNGPYLREWFEPTLGDRPTQAQLEAAEADALIWAQRPRTISYKEFWDLVPLPLQIQIANHAEVLRNQDPPDTSLKTLISKTYDPINLIYISDPVVTGSGGYFQQFMSELVDSKVLQDWQASQWANLQEVTLTPPSS